MIDCRADLKKKYPDFPEHLIDQFLNRLSTGKKNGLKGKAFADFTKKELDIMARDMARQKAAKAANSKAYKNFVVHLAKHKNPYEAMLHLIGGTEMKGIDKARVSHDNLYKAYREIFGGSFIGDLEAKDLLNDLKSGKLDQDVYVAIDRMKNKDADLKDLNQKSVEVAKIVKKHNDYMWEKEMNAGLSVGYLDGRVTKASWDARLTGGDNSDEAFKEWHDYMYPRLDKAKVFGEIKPEKHEDFLKAIWKNISAGKAGKVLPSESTGDIYTMLTRRASEQTKAGSARTLHFTDGKAAYEANLKYGQRNLFDSIVEEINQNSRRIATVKMFGSEPDKVFEMMLQHVRDVIFKKSGADGLLKFEGKEKTIRNFYESQIVNPSPARGHLVNIIKMNSMLQYMNKLGSTWIWTATDLMAGASLSKSAFGGNLLEITKSELGLFAKNLGSANLKDGMKRYRVMADMTLGGFYDRMGLDNAPAAYNLKNETWSDRGVGHLSKLQALYSKLNLMDPQAKRFKTVIIAQAAADMASGAKNGLNEYGLSTLKKYGIEPKHWDIIKKAITKDDIYELEVIVPESIEGMELKNFMSLLTKEEKADQRVNLILMRKRDEVAMSVQNYLSDHGNLGMRVPDARAKFMMRGGNIGIAQDNVFTKMMDAFWQFKSFAWMTQRLSERVFNAGSGNQVKDLAAFFVGSTMLGYGSMVAFDTLHDRVPMNPLEPATWVKASEKGGGLALYGDLTLRNFQNNKYTSSGDFFIPPTGRAIGDVVELADLVLKGKFNSQTGSKPVARQAMKTLVDNWLPFKNLWFVKPALDSIIINNVKDITDPHWRFNQLKKQIKGEVPKALGWKEAVGLD